MNSDILTTIVLGMLFGIPILGNVIIEIIREAKRKP